MGQSRIGPQHLANDKSFSSSRYQYERQFTFGDSENYEWINNAICFTNDHLMIDESLYINGYFLSVCKLTFNYSYNLKEIKNVLEKENKIFTFQHEFERISKDFRFRNRNNLSNTIIEQVNISELYKQINQTQQQIDILESFGTSNSSNQQIQQRKRNSNRKNQFLRNNSSEEDFTDNDNEGKSKSVSPNQKPQEPNKKNIVILHKNFQIDSERESGQENKQILQQNQKLGTVKKQELFYDPSINDEGEQELVNQVHSDIESLKVRIERNIGPSYKKDQICNQLTSNYQKLIDQQKQDTQSSLEQHKKKSLIEQQQEFLRNNKINEQIQPFPSKIIQKNDMNYSQESQIIQNSEQFIQQGFNNKNQSISSPKNTLQYKPIVSKEYQKPLDNSSQSSCYKAPWGTQKANILNQTSSSESDTYNIQKQRQNKQKQQPINITVNLKDMNQKKK